MSNIRRRDQHTGWTKKESHSRNINKAYYIVPKFCRWDYTDFSIIIESNNIIAGYEIFYALRNL